MSDTYIGVCKLCQEETDLIQGLCQECLLKDPKPRVFKDGDKWCALNGADLQTGVAGFGDSAEEAERNYWEAASIKYAGQSCESSPVDKFSENPKPKLVNNL